MGVLDWLTKYEALALWLEGIALVAIFIWDRLDNRREHRETIKQIKLAQDQITAVQNAERAWVLTKLEWPASEALKVVLGSSTQRGSPKEEHTTVSVMLHCRNEGRSPAFIDKITGYGYIAKSASDPPPPVNQQAQREAGSMGPLGPGKEGVRIIQLTHPGYLENDQVFLIFVVVKYRDIFNNERLTTCGYIVIDAHMYGDENPERNKFT